MESEKNKLSQEEILIFRNALETGNDLEAIKIIDLIPKPDLDEKIGYSDNALMFASFHGRDEVVQYLIQQGADVNKRNENGWTASMKAAFSDNFACLELLINSGADVNYMTEFGNSVLSSACVRGSLEMVDFLLRAGVDARVCGGQALVNAAIHGQVSLVSRLLACGAPVGFRDQDGWTPLHCASKHGHLAVAEELLGGGADPQEKDGEGLSSLDLASLAEMKQLLGAHKNNFFGR